MSDTEGIPYDDDFEEASDDDAKFPKSPAAAAVVDEDLPGCLESSVAEVESRLPSHNGAAQPGVPPLAASSGSSGPRRPRRQRAEDAPSVAARLDSDPMLDGDATPPAVPSVGSRATPRRDVMERLPERPGSGSDAGLGRRVVRGKVSVAGHEGPSAEMMPRLGSIGGTGVRPNSGESQASGRVPRPLAAGGSAGFAGVAGTGETQSAAVSSKPLWLQHDESSGLASRHRDPFGDAHPARLGGASGPVSNGVRAASRGLDAPGSGAAQAGSSRRGVAGLPSRRHESDEETAGGDGDDRKLKRLQGEIQRLTQRLKEAELFSVQDEGLACFILDDVDVHCQIAQGGFSSVHTATWHGTRCALKKIFDPVITEELRSEFENEVRMLRRLRHPNVVTLMAVCRKPPALSILTEYVAGGSLSDLIHGPPHSRARDAPPAEPWLLLPIAREAASALAYMHAMLVVHRDVKSQNVLLTPGQRPTAKLCDFGLARMKSELGTGTMQWAGTPSYMAPELFAKMRYNEAVDVFAMGVMLWEVVSLELPHANLEPADIYSRVKKKDGAGLAVPASWPKCLKILLRSAMAVQAESRPTMTHLVHDLQDVIHAFPAPD
eukprot:TRINITY_DN91341_c0_g1_i1.p1 TRINITY_DN91341_c0_g1~~TRINITY_DN91341_c0_g1_i1.p1  ORF type:complete len:624 (-),score=70.14 TRINITY_DN91341_c0_g1_i1:5-1822(-)